MDLKKKGLEVRQTCSNPQTTFLGFVKKKACKPDFSPKLRLNNPAIFMVMVTVTVTVKPQGSLERGGGGGSEKFGGLLQTPFGAVLHILNHHILDSSPLIGNLGELN